MLKSLMDLYEYLKEGNKFESIDFEEYESVSCDCECIDNEVYEDENFYEFLEDINAYNEVYRTEDKIAFTDHVTTIEVSYVDVANRFDDTYPDESIFLFDTIKLVEA